AKKRLWTRYLPQLVVILLIVLVAGVFLWRTVERRAARNREAREQDVRSSHELALHAATQADTELLTPLLSGREPRWTATQLALLEQDLLFAGAATALGFERATQEASITDISWAADLQEAYVTTRHEYQVTGGA